MATFVVSILGVNDPPYVISPLPDTMINATDDWTILANSISDHFDDIDNNDLLFEAKSLSPNFEVNLIGNILEGRSINNWIGLAKVAITAFDDQSSISDTMEIMVFVDGNLSITKAGSVSGLRSTSNPGVKQIFFHPEDSGVILQYTTYQDAIDFTLDFYRVDNVTTASGGMTAKRMFVVSTDQAITHPILFEFFITNEEMLELLNSSNNILDNIIIKQWTGNNENDSVQDNTNGTWFDHTPIVTLCPDGYKLGITVSQLSEFWITAPVIPNMAPKLKLRMNNIVFLEDANAPKSVCYLNEYFVDPDGDVLRFEALSHDDHLTVSIDTGCLILRSDSNWFGSTTVTITAYDDDTLSVSYTVGVTVVAVNDKPTITAHLSDTFMYQTDEWQDIVYNVSSYFNDVDNNMRFVATSDEGSLQLRVAEDNLQAFCDNFVGQAGITITAIGGSDSVWQSMLLDVVSRQDTIDVIDIVDGEDTSGVITSVPTYQDISSTIAAYPNPTSNQITIKFIDDYRGAFTITVYNLVGQVMFTSKLNKVTSTYTLEVDLSLYPAGTYFIDLVTDDGKKGILRVIKN